MKPVITLFKLLLSYSVNFCTKPSIINGMKQKNIKEILKKPVKCTMISPKIKPNRIPVHLAHKGN